MRNKAYDELKKDIIREFRDKDNTYECSDRLQVVLHEILDEWVSGLSTSDVHEYLKDFDETDYKTLDEGLYEGTLKERGLDVFNRVLLYCLIEQDLYNDNDFNKLQNVVRVAGIKLK